MYSTIWPIFYLNKWIQFLHKKWSLGCPFTRSLGRYRAQTTFKVQIKHKKKTEIKLCQFWPCGETVSAHLWFSWPWEVYIGSVCAAEYDYSYTLWSIPTLYGIFLHFMSLIRFNKTYFFSTLLIWLEVKILSLILMVICCCKRSSRKLLNFGGKYME